MRRGRDGPGKRAGAHEARPQAAVMLLACLAFGTSLAGGFLFDDAWIVRDDPRVQGLGGFLEIWTTPYWRDTFSGLYRPVTLLSFAAGRALHGPHPLGFHLVNLLLHAAASLLVYRLARRVLGGGGALLAGALFAVHPVHAEAVAPLVGRSELLAALFLLGSLLALFPETPGGRRGGVRVAGGVVLFAMALLSKEIAMVGLPLLILLDAAPPGGEGGGAGGRLRDRLRRRIPLYLALLALTAGFLAAKSAVTGTALVSPRATHPVDNPLIREAAPARIFTAVAVLGSYGMLLLFPIRLSYDYSLAQVPVLADPWHASFLLSSAGYALLAGIVVLSRRRSRALFVGAGWYLVALLPVSNLLFPIGTIKAERLLYLPSVGFVILGVGALRAAASARGGGARGAGRLPALLGALCVGILLARSTARSLEWTSVDALYESGVRAAPRSARTHCELGKLLFNRSLSQPDPAARRRLVERSLRELEAGVAIHDSFDPVANLALGLLLEGRMRLRAALACFERSARAAPHLAEAQLGRLRLLGRLGRRDDLVAAIRALLEAPPPGRGLGGPFWAEAARLASKAGATGLARRARARSGGE